MLIVRLAQRSFIPDLLPRSGFLERKEEEEEVRLRGCEGRREGGTEGGTNGCRSRERRCCVEEKKE